MHASQRFYRFDDLALDDDALLAPHLALAARALGRNADFLHAGLARRADLTFAQFVLLTPFPGTLDFEKWASQPEQQNSKVGRNSERR